MHVRCTNSRGLCPIFWETSSNTKTESTLVKRPKRPRDPNQLGKLIVDLSVGEASEAESLPDSPAVEFARQGGLKGGNARAAALTPEKRREIAMLAAKSRWGRISLPPPRL